ncbi:MAG TPA: ABC transporter substrate-binding protein [Rubrobacter sp.]|nr:ABC transporter substrate-binding protein [Rubrobacter sp.]
MTERNEGPGASAGRKLNRRDFLKMSGAGLAGAALLGASGCGGGGGGSGNITFSMGPDDPNKSFTKLIDKFNEQHKGEFQVIHREMPTDTGQYFDKLRTEFQAGGGDIDVIGGDVIWPIQFAAQGWVQDLSDRFPASEQNKFLPAPIEASIYEGAIYAVPWFEDAGLLYSRSDLLEQAGYSAPPETWDELKEMALKTSQDTGTPNGFVFQGSNYEGGVCNALEYIRTHGGDVLSDVTSGEVVIDSPEAAAGLETYHSMVTDGVAPQAVANYTETESDPVLYNGETVFIRDWPGVYGDLGSGKYKVKQEQVALSPIPVASGNQSSSTLGGWTFMINAQTDMPDEAWEFVKFMSSYESFKFRAVEGGYISARKAILEDPEVQEAIPTVKLAKDVLLDYATSRPVTQYYGDMSLEMQSQFNDALTGDVSPQQAVETLQKNLTTIMKQAD